MIAWPWRPGFDDGRQVASGRWVVVDVETSGLDASRDALLAIGALGVVDGRIDLADAFEVVLRQDGPSAARNIEVHGITGDEQLAGAEPAEALAAFLAFIGHDPLVAWHASFDELVLRRALSERLGSTLRRAWLDLAHVAPLAWPGRVGREGSLDLWLEALAIPIAFRHRALADCLATAQLLLAVLHEAPRLGAPRARDLLKLSGSRRWLG